MEPNRGAAGARRPAPGRSTDRSTNKFERSERGAAIIEYLLLLTLIAVAGIAGITAFGSATRSSLTNSSNTITQSVQAAGR